MFHILNRLGHRCIRPQRCFTRVTQRREALLALEIARPNDVAEVARLWSLP